MPGVGGGGRILLTSSRIWFFFVFCCHLAFHDWPSEKSFDAHRQISCFCNCLLVVVILCLVVVFIDFLLTVQLLLYSCGCCCCGSATHRHPTRSFLAQRIRRLCYWLSKKKKIGKETKKETNVRSVDTNYYIYASAILISWADDSTPDPAFFFFFFLTRQTNIYTHRTLLFLDLAIPPFFSFFF